MIYLIHFDQPYKHARHYVGSADDVQARLHQHRAGAGARLTQVAVSAGIGLVLARVWPGGRAEERLLKVSYKHCFTTLCPICRASKRRAPRRKGATNV